MARIPDTTREAIAADLRAGVLSHRQIGDKYGVGIASVSRIGSAEGIDSGERSGLEKARQAAEATYKERRARIRAQIALDVEEEQRRLWAPVTIGKFGGKDNDWNQVDLPEPPSDVRRDIWTNMAIGIDKMAVMDRADTGAEIAAGLVDELVSGLRAKRAG